MKTLLMTTVATAFLCASSAAAAGPFSRIRDIGRDIGRTIVEVGTDVTDAIVEEGERFVDNAEEEAERMGDDAEHVYEEGSDELTNARENIITRPLDQLVDEIDRNGRSAEDKGCSVVHHTPGVNCGVGVGGDYETDGHDDDDSTSSYLVDGDGVRSETPPVVIVWEPAHRPERGEESAEDDADDDRSPASRAPRRFVHFNGGPPQRGLPWAAAEALNHFSEVLRDQAGRTQYQAFMGAVIERARETPFGETERLHVYAHQGRFLGLYGPGERPLNGDATNIGVVEIQGQKYDPNLHDLSEDGRLIRPKPCTDS